MRSWRSIAARHLLDSPAQPKRSDQRENSILLLSRRQCFEDSGYKVMTIVYEEVVVFLLIVGHSYGKGAVPFLVTNSRPTFL